MFGIGRFIKKIFAKRYPRNTLLLGEFEKIMREYHQAHLCNQIALANNAEGPVVLYTPWNTTSDGTWNTGSKTLLLERHASGCLSFIPDDGKNATKPVYIMTVPKSGTHLIQQVFLNMGFTQGSISFKGNDIFIDYRNVNNKKDYLFKSEQSTLPYPLIVNLTSPGNVYAGHVANPDHVRLVHRNDKILMSVRDLRVSLVSYVRMIVYAKSLFKELGEKEKGFPVNSELTSELFSTHWNTPYFDEVFSSAKNCVELMNEPFVRVLRFEELTSTDPEILKKPAEAIAEIAECSVTKALALLQEANGQKTNTYTGHFSELGNFWNQDVENKFIEFGGDIINEQLGYSRHYNPQC